MSIRPKRLMQASTDCSISEGTLILTCKEAKAGLILKKLARKGIPASVVGEVIPESRGIILVENGKERTLEHPRVDPFWPAFAKALAGKS